MKKGEGPRSNRGGVRLTERELSVLRLLVKGMTYNEVAAALYITGNTAREYIARIYQKLGVKRRSACVARAEELELDRK